MLGVRVLLAMSRATRRRVIAMNAALRATANAPVTLPPRPRSARPERAAAAAASGVSASPQQRASTDPFASLKQEQTIEAKVSPQLLTWAKEGLAMGGATLAYEIPEELMALAGRRTNELRGAPPPALPARVPADAATSSPLDRVSAEPEPKSVASSAFRRLAAPQRDLPAALPSIPAAPASNSFNWLAASVISYALLCLAYWLLR